MQTRRMLFVVSFVATLLVLSTLADRGTTQGIVTGVIVQAEAGEWMSVANDGTGPIGLPIALRPATTYEGSPAGIKPGVRVRVWYRSVGERRFVANKVRVLADATSH